MKKKIKIAIISVVVIFVGSLSYIEFTGVDAGILSDYLDFSFITDLFDHEEESMDGGEGLVGAEIPDAQELDPEAKKAKLLTKRDELEYELIIPELRVLASNDVSTEELNRIEIGVYTPPEVTGDIGIADAIELSKKYIESVIESEMLTNGIAIEFFNEFESENGEELIPVVRTEWSIDGEWEKDHFVGDYSNHKIVAVSYCGEELTGDMRLFEKFSHSRKDTNGKAEETAIMAVKSFGEDIKYINYNIENNSVFMTVKAETDTGNATGYRNSMYSRTSQFLEDVKSSTIGDVNIMWYTEIPREEGVEEAQIAYMSFSREKIDEFDFTEYFSLDEETEIRRYTVEEFVQVTQAYREELAINPNNH